MNRFFLRCLGSALLTLLGFGATVQAAPHVWNLTSPDHGQTFSYGSEQNRVWTTRGADRHLALLLNFTNDPYVDRVNPRQYDYFTFNFPQITLGSDGRTFSYHAKEGHTVSVAIRNSGFLGIDEIKLLPTSFLLIKKPHGFLTLMLIVGDRPPRPDAE